MFFPVFLIIALVVFTQSVQGRTNLPSVHMNCTVNYGERLLREGESIEIKGKLHKVEDCGLHRAYHACGTHLLYIINMVCQVIERQKQKNSIKTRRRRFLQRKLLTEACCENLCTVSEMTRYCP